MYLELAGVVMVLWALYAGTRWILKNVKKR